MRTATSTGRRRIVTVVLATAAPCAAAAVLAGPPATGANDPCAASEVARTIGSVSKSMGDYLDAHPETNQAMTTMLQQQAGPQSLDSMKSYLQANPKVALDMTSIAQPLTNVSTQCKLPITLPQALGLMQQAQGATGGSPAATGPVPPAPGGALLPGVTVGTPSGPVGVPPRANNVG
ncbi:hemophore [Mycobacterium sp. IS-2888]|uniref:hemophore n=1 Tax=Mycobacterium sp. IS-2888 TaxID=1834159 RepID=UPI00096D9836|nr:hemophore [Mycobacterium sp. IS-2888]OMC51389.1 hemophore [Mycobacterium sp. IS-2888]